jgi:hypothetical protein
LESLAEGRHPYCDFLHLLEHHDDIDDDRWVQLNDSITQAFGKPLAIATARKKLRMKSPPSDESNVMSDESPVKNSQASELESGSALLTPHPSVITPPANASDQMEGMNNESTVTQDQGRLPEADSSLITHHSSLITSPAAATALGTMESPVWEGPGLADRNTSNSSHAIEHTIEIDLASDGRRLKGSATEPDLHLPTLLRHEPLPENEGTLRRGLPEENWLRSPLTAQQELDLLAPSNGVAVLFGSRVAGLDDVDRFLHTACREGRLITLDTANDRRGFLRQLDELLKDRPDGLILGVVPDYCPWSEDWVLSSLELIGRSTSKRKFARILFIADPEATWSWVQTDKSAQDRMAESGVAEFSLEPWSDQALRQWMSEAGFGPEDQAGRDCFKHVTANWGALLYQLGLRCKQSPERWQEVVVDYERELAQRVEWGELLQLVGQALPVLKVMAERDEPVSWEEISSHVGGGSPILVAMVLCWADRLRYIRPAGQKKWVLDPIIRQAVMNANV